MLDNDNSMFPTTIEEVTDSMNSWVCLHWGGPFGFEETLVSIDWFMPSNDTSMIAFGNQRESLTCGLSHSSSKHITQD